MMRDTKYFPDPDAFKPERYVAKVEAMKDPTQALSSSDCDDPTAIAFGFGRRYGWFFNSHLICET